MQVPCNLCIILGAHIKLDLSGWFLYQCLEFKMVVIGFEYNLQSAIRTKLLVIELSKALI